MYVWLFVLLFVCSYVVYSVLFVCLFGEEYCKVAPVNMVLFALRGAKLDQFVSSSVYPNRAVMFVFRLLDGHSNSSSVIGPLHLGDEFD